LATAYLYVFQKQLVARPVVEVVFIEI